MDDIRKMELPIIDLEINNISIRCFVDTGSQITLVRDDIFHKLNGKRTSINVTVSTVNGSIMKCQYAKEITLCIGLKKLSGRRVICAPTLNQEMTLGYDNIREEFKIDRSMDAAIVDGGMAMILSYTTGNENLKIANYVQIHNGLEKLANQNKYTTKDLAVLRIRKTRNIWRIRTKLCNRPANEDNHYRFKWTTKIVRDAKTGRYGKCQYTGMLR